MPQNTLSRKTRGKIVPPFVPYLMSKLRLFLLIQLMDILDFAVNLSYATNENLTISVYSKKYTKLQANKNNSKS